MRDPIDDDVDDIDRAYRGAVETTSDVALVRRRRGAVLAAVEALDAVHETPVDRPSAAPGERRAANESHRYVSATWWRGMAAACVIGTSTLVVMQMQQEPEATVESRLRSDAGRASAPTGESTAARDGEAAPRRSGVAIARAPAPEPAPAPAPAPPIVTGPSQRAPASRAEQPSASPQEALGAAAVQLPSDAAAAAGNAVARNTPGRETFTRLDKATVPAPGAGLLVAVNKGDIEAARTALQTTDPDAERDADGRTALAIAVLRADLPLVKLLLESGANRRAEDRYGQTPLSYANASGDAQMRQALERP